MRARVLAFSILGLLTLAAQSARADDACAEDRKKLCPGVKGRKLGGCMRQHQAELSEACKQQHSAVKEAREEIHKDCAADVEKLCKDDKRKGICLKNHEAELSAECKDARAKGKALRQKIHPGCKPDVEKLCADVQKGNGDVHACLVSHQAELTGDCKAAMEKRAAKKAAKKDAGKETPAAK